MLGLPIVFTNGASCVLCSFNYRFFSASDFHANDTGEDTFVYITKSGINITMKRTGNNTAKASEELMEVSNLDDLIEQNFVNQIIDDLTNVRHEKREPVSQTNITGGNR
jgi:cellulose synthase (UDP-forming)